MNVKKTSLLPHRGIAALLQAGHSNNKLANQKERK